jgi:hypothetical protein
VRVVRVKVAVLDDERVQVGADVLAHLFGIGVETIPLNFLWAAAACR